MTKLGVARGLVSWARLAVAAISLVVLIEDATAHSLIAATAVAVILALGLVPLMLSVKNIIAHPRFPQMGDGDLESAIEEQIGTDRENRNLNWAAQLLSIAVAGYMVTQGGYLGAAGWVYMIVTLAGLILFVAPGQSMAGRK